MIGYYVHHVGTGHLNRAREVARVAGTAVTGLSSLPAPDDWPGEWVQLERDDAGAPDGDAHATPVPVAASTGCRWGTRDCASAWRALSSWIERARPDVLVSDVSVEVALLARLHGVRVVSVVMPGNRGDRAHRLGVRRELASSSPRGRGRRTAWCAA